MASDNKVSAPSSNTNNSDTAVREVDKGGRNKKIIKWSIFFAIIAGIIIGIYFSCRPSSSHITINATSGVTTSGSNIVLKDDKGKDYIVAKPIENTIADIYASTNENSVYIFYASTKNGGRVNFRATYTTMAPDTTGRIHFGGSGFSIDAISGDQDVVEWFKKVTTTKSNYWSQPASFGDYMLQFLPTILFILLMLYMWKKMGSGGMGSGEESIFSMGKSQGKLVVSNVKFTDVAGIEEEKAELIEIVDYLKRPARYAAMGARTPKGVILYGPPGTGKTLLAKAVSGEAKVPFFQVSGSAFEDMLVGVGAKRVRDLFAKARKAAPAIIFIDEIDSVASKRGKYDMTGGGIADQTINQLLAEMDGFSTRAGVVVIAATNRLESLDDAILRPGRFDRHIQVNLPDIKEREAILRIHAKNKNISSVVSFTDIARRTPGMSGAQLENVLNEATLLAVRFDKTTIGMKEIDEGIDRVIAGPAKKSRVITESERRQIAVHEAGHALVGLYTPGTDVVEKITIIPRGQAGGYTVSNPEKQETQIKTKKELLNLITALMGGRAAEEVEYSKDDVSTGASNDLYRASALARGMVMQLGMTGVSVGQLVPSEGQQSPYQQKMYSEDTAQKADVETEKILKAQYDKAVLIISKNKVELLLIVETLLALETIVKDQIDYIHKNKKMPEEAIKAKADIAKEKNAKEGLKSSSSETKTSKKTSKKDDKEKSTDSENKED
ncbi:MAG: hypothetical protein Ta2E_02110 [Mycoplasmoidaceae bacterium]|nr:MAG: hypothetical protein Ta2E_02110 [Mycoplasmoidaceae bacterium]